MSGRQISGQNAEELSSNYIVSKYLSHEIVGVSLAGVPNL